MNVLIVEDNALILELTRELLAGEGLSVESINGGPDVEALFTDRLHSPPPDAVVLDHYLPGARGLELLRRMRRVPGWYGVPAVIASAASDDVAAELVREAESLGRVAVLRKPFEAADLLRALGAESEV